jgi:hypothetical protein
MECVPGSKGSRLQVLVPLRSKGVAERDPRLVVTTPVDT